jgi:hypothetical protein
MNDYGVTRLRELILNYIGSQDEPPQSYNNEIIEILSSLAASLRDGEYCLSPALTA